MTSKKFPLETLSLSWEINSFCPDDRKDASSNRVWLILNLHICKCFTWWSFLCAFVSFFECASLLFLKCAFQDVFFCCCCFETPTHQDKNLTRKKGYAGWCGPVWGTHTKKQLSVVSLHKAFSLLGMCSLTARRGYTQFLDRPSEYIFVGRKGTDVNCHYLKWDFSFGRYFNHSSMHYQCPKTIRE